MKNIKLLLLGLLLVVAAGCSSGSSDAPLPGGSAHPANWQSVHSSYGKADLRGCQGCHGFDFAGSGAAISCLPCHPGAPPFGPGAGHPTSWNNNPVQGHQDNFSATSSPVERRTWTSCATAACHGVNLEGGSGGPTCQNASCHTTSTNAGWPPAPSTHGANYDLVGNHGADAKDTLATGLNMGNYCFLCHGSGTNSFDGGYVSLLYGAVGNCSGCHASANAHPPSWLKANAAVNTQVHSNPVVTATTRNTGCALCHNTSSGVGNSPVPAAPSCYVGSRGVYVCHSTGPTGANHDVPWADAYAHGTAAKADLTNCQTCHSDNPTGGANSNPRFNLATGGMASGCEGCHATNSAHPTDTDRWTFNQVDGGGGIRRTHFASGNAPTACARCHIVNGVGTRTACVKCHVDTTSFALTCTACHGYPPLTGDTQNDTGGATLVHHKGVTLTTAGTQHEVCSLCHGVKSNGSGVLDRKNSAYALFDKNGTYPLNQGGDHLDGSIEMNGPTATNSGAGYNAANFGCDLACHGDGTDGTHFLSDSGLTPAYDDYGSGVCDSCHGYPPNGSGGSTDHLTRTGNSSSDATFYASHGVCSTCHGVSGNTSPLVSPVASSHGTPIDNTGAGGDAYTLSLHNDGLVQMNGGGTINDAGYSEASNGCTGACHSVTYKFSGTIQANTVKLLKLGGGSCSSCHGYPPDGSVPVGSRTGVIHSATLTANHGGDCTLCHGNKETAGAHTPATNYTVATDHNTGTIHLNSLLGYDQATTQGCTKACHANDASHQMSSSTLTVATADYGGLTCTSCHGYPPTATGHAYNSTAVNHPLPTSLKNDHGDCQFCHGYKNNGSNALVIVNPGTLGGDVANPPIITDHYDGSVTMNGDLNTTSGDDAGYNPTNGGCDSAACHINDATHRVGAGNTGSTISKRDIGPGLCSTCHFIGNTVSAPEVTGSSTHVKTTTAGVFGDCTDCHSGHVGSPGPNGVDIGLPPTNWLNASTGETHVTGVNMRTALGLSYNSHGGIHLGGPGTHASISSYSTEAEICWGCHDANSIGEFATGAGATYKFGVLSTSQTNTANHVSDWTTTDAWRIDAYDARLTRPIASVHTAYLGTGPLDSDLVGHSSSVANNIVSGKVKRGNVLTMPGTASGQNDTSAVVLEDKQYIRCTYCHDVHSLNKAPTDPNFGTLISSAPYLRGTWLSDPYSADYPPAASQDYGNASTVVYSNQQAGGMPRAKTTSVAAGGYFIDQNSGNPTVLTANNSVAKTAGLCTLCHGTTINSMNYYSGSMWRSGGNGHANAALGGTGTGKINLFDARRAASWYMSMQGPRSLNSEINSTAPPWGSTLRNTNTQPKFTRNSGWYGGTAGSTTRGGDYTAWYSASGIGGHTGTAGAKAHDFSCSKCHSPHATGLPALLKTNCLDVGISGYANPNNAAVNPTASTANNCHRKTSTADGWHTLAPRQ